MSETGPPINTRSIKDLTVPELKEEIERSDLIKELQALQQETGQIEAPKPFWKSKTLVTNVAIGLTYFFANPESFGITPEVALKLTAMVNIGLRMVTGSGLSMKLK